MNCRTVTNQKGEDFTLTIEEEKYMRAFERIAKMNPGRISLFGSGHLDFRINGGWANDVFYNHSAIGIYCEGGDGGDNY